MSDRGFLFLFSVFMILGGLGAAAWLIATGQAGSVDGLFMLLVALLTAAVFGLYLKFLIGRALRETAKAPAQPAKAGAAAATGKPAPAAAVQQ